MFMRRKTTKLWFAVTLSALTVIVSACNLTSMPAAPDHNATYTAVSALLFTQLAALPTPTLVNTPTPSSTLAPVFQTTTAQPTYSIPTSGPRPLHYTLQLGEFPYCIARRFNVDPKELLAINYLSSGLAYIPGMVLTIPQSGRPFPASRALHSHPTTYTVPENQMPVYKVACYFGDVDPAVIMQTNGLTSPTLNLGQTLYIP
jgi:LysM repeat protein